MFQVNDQVTVSEFGGNILWEGRVTVTDGKVVRRMIVNRSYVHYLDVGSEAVPSQFLRVAKQVACGPSDDDCDSNGKA